MNMELRRLTHEDVDYFMELVKVFEDVFEMHDFDRPPKQHLQRLVMKQDFIALVAISNREVIGGLTAYVLEHCFSERPLVYLLDLAVKRDHQRQGVGRKLVADLLVHCKSQGFQEIFVQADKSDDYAIDFYRKTGIAKEEEVVHFSYAL